jgi:HSP90 family molecular chaperone
MSERTKDRIAFDVETSRILQILSSEIYDCPKAFLRENVQNAYDAVLMRSTAQGLKVEEQYGNRARSAATIDCDRAARRARFDSALCRAADRSERGMSRTDAAPTHDSC